MSTGVQARGLLLSVRNVAKTFGGLTAVEDASVLAHPGEIVSVIGPNGAGKTSVLNMVSGFYHPDRGSIWLGREEITHLSPNRIARLGVARTFQNTALFKGMTVLDNIMLGRHLHVSYGICAALLRWGPAAKAEAAHRSKAAALIDLLDLQRVQGVQAGVLPYGVQKRVELGRALAMEPKVLLLDEPMGGMNQAEKDELVHCVLRINEEYGVTIVLIEHDMSVVMKVSNRVFVLDRGRTIAEGDPPSVQSNPEVVRAYLGDGSTYA